MHARIPTRRLRAATAALLVSAFAAACGGDSPTQPAPGGGNGGGGNPPQPDVVSTVQVEPAAVQLATGETRHLAATPRTAAGAALPDRAVAWSSSNPQVASVTSNGIVVTHQAGDALIRATADGKTGEAAVHVSDPAPAPVASVQVTPADVTLSFTQPTTLAATVRDAAGNVLHGREVTWTSSDSSTVEVAADGRLIGRRGGTAVITATSGGRTGQATVRVPLWITYRVVGTAANRTLPMSVDSSSYTDAQGNLHRVNVLVTDGSLRLSTVDHRWEQTLMLTIWDGVGGIGSARAVTLHDEGAVVYEDFGGIAYHSTVHPFRVLRPRVEAGGAMLIAQATDETKHAATYAYVRQ